jgi:hypothetical protein
LLSTVNVCIVPHVAGWRDHAAESSTHHPKFGITITD